MITEAKALAALESISIEVGKANAHKGISLDLGTLCETYRAIRPKLIAALVLIDLIPVYGKKIGDAIRFLMSMADVACPTK